MNKIIVLDDGLRFSCIGDSKIMWITDAGMALLDEGHEPNDLSDVFVKRWVYVENLLYKEKIKRDMP